MKTKVKKLKCFRCRQVINIPQDYVGNPYTLLEVHYMVAHSIDLKNFDWNDPRDINGDEVILLQIDEIETRSKKKHPDSA